ncbi:toxin-antitoxin system, antitoxin component, Xre family protein [Thermoleptolyngbya oregonensis NK1-22]|uniref:Toxin-antitoxin system, antitoxin component, Xre family protein n=1 Tax=Thermoleptolyngbya oregonensis NK1-22 TaxID=2547457 RepID=A0AA96YAQ3_9CYAN|nr:hypothetical protein [Thermoleptolyngbya oregonensis]WOB44213.1 toxin-antitoxin system, antitoxin component, Xre family protein [Thermoleptolyngbya oregonensis NK1-22]
MPESDTLNSERLSTDIEQELLEKLRSLPSEKVLQVLDFIEFLWLRNRDAALVHAASRSSEASFGRIWDNPLDAEYDQL